MQKHKIWIVLGVVILLIVALVYWLMPPSTSAHTSPQPSSNNETAQALKLQRAMQNHPAANFLSPSQQDTEVNCQLRLDSSNRLIVNEQTISLADF